MAGGRVRATRRELLRAAPWVGILAAISVTQIVRDQPFDAVLFGLGAVAIAVDALGLLPDAPVGPSIQRSVLLAAGGVVIVVLVVAPRHGIVSGLAVGAVGVLAVALAWFRRPPLPVDDSAAASALRRTRVRRAAIGWAIVVVALCLVELWSFLMGRLTAEAKGQHPAVSELLDPALDSPIGRLVFGLVWVGLGVALLTTRRRRDA